MNAALLLAIAGAGLAALAATYQPKLPRRKIRFIGASGRPETAVLRLPATIVDILLPAPLRAVWDLFVGYGRGPVGDQLTTEEPTLQGLEGLRWRMLFAGYRRNDLAWLRRRQLKFALVVLLLGATIVYLFSLPFILWIVLPIASLAFGMLAVRAELGWRVEERRRRIRTESVHFFYGLASFLAATLPIEDALRDLTEGEHTELAYETRRLLLQVGAGMSLTRAFSILAARCNTDEVTMAINRINVALTSGSTALAPSLRVIANQTRQTIAAQRIIRRRRAVQRNYAFLAVTAVPAIIVAVAAPAISQAFHTLF